MSDAPNDIYLSRFGEWQYPLSGIQRMTSRRSGPHANLVAKIQAESGEKIIKVPAVKGSRYATRAIQKEFQVLQRLSNTSFSTHLPTPISLHTTLGDRAAEYQPCKGVPMNLFMARHIQESVWQHLFDWTVSFLADLGRSRDNLPAISLNDPKGALIRRPLAIIETVFPADVPAIRTYLDEVLTDDLPYHFVPVHGDFNPWNMLVTAGSSASELHPFILDWEDFTPYGLPMFDGFYYMLVCIWILAFGETQTNNLSALSIDDLIVRNHMMTKLAKGFCLNYGREMKLNSHMIDPLFILFLLRATAEDIRAKRHNPRSAARWWDILKFGLRENIFLNAVKMMFLYALRAKGQMTQNSKLLSDIQTEIRRVTSANNHR